DEAEDTLGLGSRRDLVKDLLRGDRDQRGQARWLPDDRVAADKRDGPSPARNGDRKVEGRDDPDHAQRMPLLDQPVIAPLGGDIFAEQLARLRSEAHTSELQSR